MQLSSITVAAFLAALSSASPLAPRDNGCCIFSVSCTHLTFEHSFLPFSCFEEVRAPSGELLVQASTDYENLVDPLVVEARDWFGAGNVSIHAHYDPTSSHLDLSYDFQGASDVKVGTTPRELRPSNTDPIFISTGSWTLPCSA